MKTAENLRVRRMVLCALFAALTAVCSQIAIPMPWGVPINLALFAVYMAGTMLGAFWGTVSQLVFVALAAIGVPVLAGFQGGPSAIFGKTGAGLHSGRTHHRVDFQGFGPQVLVALRGHGRGLRRLLCAGHHLVHDPDRCRPCQRPGLVRPALPARRRH